MNTLDVNYLEAMDWADMDWADMKCDDAGGRGLYDGRRDVCYDALFHFLITMWSLDLVGEI